jgi:DNA-binding transcriptional ArsR family regulator
MAHRLKKQHSEIEIDAATAEQVAEAMQALATPSRVRILARLVSSPCSVNELALAVGMEASAVSHQLRLLRHLGLVRNVRQGRNVVYTLHDAHVAVLLAEAVYHVEHVRLAEADPNAGETAS